VNIITIGCYNIKEENMAHEGFPYDDPRVIRALSHIYDIALIKLAKQEAAESRQDDTEGQVLSITYESDLYSPLILRMAESDSWYDSLAKDGRI
jgi:hypothetical protein